jgi:signal transduction histidine kinase
VAVLGSGLVLQRADVAQSPAFTLAFFLLLTLLLNPMRDRLQRVVDRLYDRPSHDPQRTLEQASGALAATLDLDDIHRLTVDTIADALLLERASLWIRDAGGRLAPVAARGPAPSACLALPAEHPLLGHLQRANRALSVHDFVDGPLRGAGAEACVGALAALGAELVLPLARGDLSGFLALGAKKSRTLYTLDDLKFLSTLANQVAVAIRNAQAYRKIEELNADLERKVARRTGELAATNRELGESLRELERAYTDLQRSQENLVRAEKMAALGRVTAGIAHEVNTPLGAALNSLKVCEELAGEYARSIGDPEVTDDDHRQIAAELAELIGNVRRWTDKAAGYIRGIKAHTRSLSDVQERSFEVAQLVDDTLLLLAHRLRLSSCRVTVECPDGVTLYGDPGKLAQVLTNLITNAVDAYEGRDGAIAIRVRARAAEVEIDVEDRGCGIAPENLGRVFEELFTTKPPGKGTGLGLSISRDIVGDCFAGRIAVESAPGRGSRFTLVLPRRAPAEGRGEARATAAG